MNTSRNRPGMRRALSGASSFGWFRFLGNNLEGPHHVVIFMLQHVAVKDIAAGIAFEASDNGEHVSWVDDR